MKLNKAIYFISTGLLSILMLFSVYMYLFDHEAVKEMFTAFGYPTYIIYPYAIAKLLGVAAIWQNKFSWLKEWAYSAFFFAYILAFFAHYMIGDGEQTGALIAFILLLVSYFTLKRK